MREFLKSVLASAFGTLLAALAGGALLLVIVMAIAGSSGDGRHAAVSMKPKSMLVIGGLAIDDTPEHGSAGFDSLLFGAEGPRLDLLRALEAIDLAAKDKQVAGILLSGGLDAGIAQMAELRRALAAFKSSGKPVIAWQIGRAHV